MKRVLIAPDSFKGSLSSSQVCDVVEGALKKRYDDLEVKSIPVADGGEGTAEAFLYAVGGEKIYCTVKSPLGRDISSYFVMLPDKTAVIEMALASGLTLEKENNALYASSFGTGQLIRAALDEGAERLFIGIGGSATTDAGTGCLNALGVKFYDCEGVSVLPCGKSLERIIRIDLEGLDKRIREKDITVLCDVKNPLYGKIGAAYIFAPQKGADEKDVRLLDKGLECFAAVCEKALGKDYSECEGAGAAGGLGFALVGFLNARLRSGIDAVLDAVSFEEKAKKADLIITGEGRMDEQSFMGKVPFGVASRSGKTRVAAVVGIFEGDREKARENGISEIYETNALHKPFEEIRHKARQDLINTVNNIEI